jgi:hypothetical protein
VRLVSAGVLPHQSDLKTTLSRIGRASKLSAGANRAALRRFPLLLSYVLLDHGVGDVNPAGALRLIFGIEGTNGLFLIGWSTSFTYFVMDCLWPLHPDKK